MDVEGAAGRIARLRKLAGWSQHQLASRAFVSTSLIKKVEQGRTPPSPALIASCARALGVPPSTVYGGAPEELVLDGTHGEAAVEDLRAALHAYDDPELAEPPWSDEQLRASLHQAGRLRRAFRYERTRAWLLHGNRENSLRELDNARRTAPRHARHHPTVHETVRALARTDRRATDSLAEFARWAGMRL